MVRKKNYNVSENRAAPVGATSASPERPRPSADDACIDMVALLGLEARFPQRIKTLDLRDWLGRGIDDWVCSSGFCLKAMLLSGARATASVTTYFGQLPYLFEYLAGSSQTPVPPRPKFPSDLSPLHVQHFIGWLQKRAQAAGWRPSSTRNTYKAIKAVLAEMFAQGFIPGEPSRFFRRGALPWSREDSLQTSLSDTEQERLAKAIKSDLVDVHHGRLPLKQGAVQGLRLLLVAHRQGLNPTPLLEMCRDALAPGFLPGTIRMRTAKHRNKKVRSSIGRSALGRQAPTQPSEQPDEQDLCFDLSEGAVLQQAIASTRELVCEAPPTLKQRIWLYRAEASAGSTKRGNITCLDNKSLNRAIQGVIQRRNLLGDDGLPLRLNLSRLRKSRFDRALRTADGDIAITANLMGNTPRVAGANYPSMNEARKADAASFMNGDYTALMRTEGQAPRGPEIQPVQVQPFKVSKDGASALPTPTPVSACSDSISGEHAPNDGSSHCDRYVMCLFCSSFAIVGTVDELWRLFSFQMFAQAELDHLDEALGPERTADGLLEDLRDRYRVAIPYIDDFTQRQFARSRVAQARARTASGLHPYWQHQMTMSRRARSRALAPEPRGDGSQGDTVALQARRTRRAGPRA
ncbi:hypothetical protein M0D69_43265 [Caballeronia sp. SEWSISQ10-4 2]|jgi:hypothetical protein|uniref:hypothetical protein n=1 Tax=Caballeronia sp. SEWSISQ10-4 2 TaxID=2937438 RepID=UPI00264D519D|nr:hypothetical protein [Caballeronia sp. SEWSISQ10-4 2]MDN7184717.1 hypothetical protein [Caballeronia sp. SEWSISQ10-4 2]